MKKLILLLGILFLGSCTNTATISEYVDETSALGNTAIQTTEKMAKTSTTVQSYVEPEEDLDEGDWDLGTYRPIYYDISASFVALIGHESFHEWDCDRVENHYDQYQNECIAISFIKKFNISKKDFSDANEKLKTSMLEDGNNLEKSSLNEIYPVDLIYTFDNEKINDYFLWENSIYAHEKYEEGWFLGQEHAKNQRYRPIYYGFGSIYAKLVTQEAWYQWLSMQDTQNFNQQNECVAVRFIQYFDIKKEDFNNANEETRKYREEYGYSADKNIYYELYPVDLLYTFDNKKINDYFLWKNR